MHIPAAVDYSADDDDCPRWEHAIINGQSYLWIPLIIVTSIFVHIPAAVDYSADDDVHM